MTHAGHRAYKKVIKVPVICENLEVIKTFPIFSLCEKILTPKGMSVAMQSSARNTKEK